jgi:hypothetical protein
MFVYKRKILYYSSFQVGVIIFGSVRFLSKKITKPKLKKNQNRFKPTGFGSVRFFRTKTGLARFFFCFFSVSVWFFWFQAYKTEPIGFF